MYGTEKCVANLRYNTTSAQLGNSGKCGKKGSMWFIIMLSVRY